MRALMLSRSCSFYLFDFLTWDACRFPWHEKRARHTFILWRLFFPDRGLFATELSEEGRPRRKKKKPFVVFLPAFLMTIKRQFWTTSYHSDTFVLARLRFLAEFEQKSDFFALCLCSTGLLFGFLNDRYTSFSKLEKKGSKAKYENGVNTVFEL